MKVYGTSVLRLEISGVEGLDLIHDFESGYGHVRVVYELEAWEGLWQEMGRHTVQQAFISSGNDELMEKMEIISGVIPEYKTLCRIFDAVREALRRYEVQDKS